MLFMLCVAGLFISLMVTESGWPIYVCFGLCAVIATFIIKEMRESLYYKGIGGETPIEKDPYEGIDIDGEEEE